MIERLLATDDACSLISTLRAQHGDVYFYLSHGCCDGTAPMCLAQALTVALAARLQKNSVNPRIPTVTEP